MASVDQNYQARIEITHKFAAPVDRIWDAWAESDQLIQWWGPKGYEMTLEKMDLRPGGIFLYSQCFPNGEKMWGRFLYKEIQPPTRLVFISSFTDPKGNIIRSPMSPSWPLEIFNDMTLVGNAETTLLTIRGGPYHATDEEIKTFEAMVDMIRQGFAGTFSQLESLLAEKAKR